MPSSSLRFPGGAAFAFTIFDDTDVATRENVEPLYRLLADLGMRTTKTAWPLSHDDESSPFISSETLEDPAYLAFIKGLKEDGFEIAWHGATMETSPREQTLLGMTRFRELLGEWPRLHANHATNRENLYWGTDRVDLLPLKWLLFVLLSPELRRSQGQRAGSKYWWGDVAGRRMEYARNLTFNRVNIRSINPTMPYRDSRRSLVPYWFSAADAEDVHEFNRLTSEKNQDRLEREGGICIVATHLGKGFVQDGAVNPLTRRNLTRLAARDGWFPPVGDLLDWLRGQHGAPELSRGEWIRMQLQWAWDLAARKVRRRFPGRSMS